MPDLKALCADYNRTPTTELRVQLLDELLASVSRCFTIYENAGSARSLLASEQRRAERGLQDQALIVRTLTQRPTRLADARARLAAVG